MEWACRLYPRRAVVRHCLLVRGFVRCAPPSALETPRPIWRAYLDDSGNHKHSPGKGGRTKSSSRSPTSPIRNLFPLDRRRSLETTLGSPMRREWNLPSSDGILRLDFCPCRPLIHLENFWLCYGTR